MNITDIVEYLCCPMSGSSLRLVDIESGKRANFAPVPRKGSDVKPITAEATEQVLIAEDESFAYPIVDDIPVLLAPEKLLPTDSVIDHPAIDLQGPIYAEAYEEMTFYNSPQAPLPRDRIMGALTGYKNIAAIVPTFPEPALLWLDAPHESLAQLEAYRYLAPVADKIALQIGGSGSHAIKLLLAGARHAFLVTPMLAEARYAQCLATDFGVRDRFTAVLGLGEQIPFDVGVIDLAYSGGCFHHMRWEYLGAELHRILAKDGKFTGIDPYKTPLHTIGTKILGKREPQVYCRPITPKRLMKMKKWFPDMMVSQQAPLLRYIVLGLEKLSAGYFKLPMSTMMTLARIDNFLGRFFHLQNYGGLVNIAGIQSVCPKTKTRKNA